MAAAKPTAASETGAPFCWPKSINCAHQGHRPAWLGIIHYARQVSAGLIDGRSEGRGAVWGAAGTQLCNVVLSQPQTDDMVEVAAVLSRWHVQGCQILRPHYAFRNSAFVEFANSVWPCSDAGKFVAVTHAGDVM